MPETFYYFDESGSFGDPSKQNGERSVVAGVVSNVPLEKDALCEALWKNGAAHLPYPPHASLVKRPMFAAIVRHWRWTQHSMSLWPDKGVPPWWGREWDSFLKKTLAFSRCGPTEDGPTDEDKAMKVLERTPSGRKVLEQIKKTGVCEVGDAVDLVLQALQGNKHESDYRPLVIVVENLWRSLVCGPGFVDLREFEEWARDDTGKVIAAITELLTPGQGRSRSVRFFVSTDWRVGDSIYSFLFLEPGNTVTLTCKGKQSIPADMLSETAKRYLGLLYICLERAALATSSRDRTTVQVLQRILKGAEATGKPPVEVPLTFGNLRRLFSKQIKSEMAYVPADFNHNVVAGCVVADWLANAAYLQVNDPDDQKRILELESLIVERLPCGVPLRSTTNAGKSHVATSGVPFAYVKRKVPAVKLDAEVGPAWGKDQAFEWRPR